MAAVLWFISYVPYLFMSEQYENLTLPAKLSASLFSNTAMAFGFQLFIMYEGAGGYLLNSPASMPDNFLNNLTLRRLMSYIYGAPILDVSRSHTMTQHSR